MTQTQTAGDERLKKLEAGKLGREAKTMEAMIRLYCEAHHGTKGKDLCPQCLELRDYAFKRLACCPFGEDKPVCAKCKVHCYKPVFRERVAAMMRYAGPRIMLRHPILSLEHLFKSLTVTPPEKLRGKARPRPAAAAPRDAASATEPKTKENE